MGAILRAKLGRLPFKGPVILLRL